MPSVPLIVLSLTKSVVQLCQFLKSQVLLSKSYIWLNASSAMSKILSMSEAQSSVLVLTCCSLSYCFSSAVRLTIS